MTQSHEDPFCQCGRRKSRHVGGLHPEAWAHVDPHPLGNRFVRSVGFNQAAELHEQLGLAS